jgi:uncharacterized iron-regulated membrane protein
MTENRRRRQASLLHQVRIIHRTMGAALFAFFALIAVTGVLLGWKKHNTWIYPKSQKGTSTDLAAWLPVDSLHRIANRALHDSVDSSLSTVLDRIDIRPDKGMVKFIYADHFWGLQLDGATGKLLHIERRRSDFIEKLHDGSILDFYTGVSGGWIKLTYTSVTGLALLGFTISGFWLWYGPKRLRRNSRNWQ